MLLFVVHSLLFQPSLKSKENYFIPCFPSLSIFILIGRGAYTAVCQKAYDEVEEAAVVWQYLPLVLENILETLLPNRGWVINQQHIAHRWKKMRSFVVETHEQVCL